MDNHRTGVKLDYPNLWRRIGVGTRENPLGSFFIKYELDEKQKKKTLKAKTFVAAKRERDRLLGEEHKQDVDTRKRCDVAFKEWVEYKGSEQCPKKYRLGKRTVRSYKALWNAHGVHILGRKPVHDVKVGDIKAVLKRMREEGYKTGQSKRNPEGEQRWYSEAAYAKMTAILSGFFKKMVEDGYHGYNPCSRLGEERPQASREIRKVGRFAVYSNDEIARIADTAQAADPERSGVVFRMLVLLTVWTGMRMSEVLGLTWENVHIDEEDGSWVDVVQQLEDDYVVGEGGTWFGPLKGDKDRGGCRSRMVPLSDDAVRELRAFLKWALANNCYRGRNGLVFMTRNFTPISQNACDDRFDRAVERAGVTRREKKPTFHWLRHTFASKAFALGVPLETVSNLLGHRNPQITREVYVHFYNRKQYVDSIAAQLSGRSEEAV